MKTRFLFLLACVLVQPAAAQYQFRIQANAAALRTHLSNATDNASEFVTSSPKIAPNGGVTLSWVNPDKNGFQGLRAGLDYLWYRQNTEGSRYKTIDPAYKPTAFTTSSLHYLSVPLEARFGLAGKRGIVPFATVGMYASALITYTETKRQTFGDPNTPGKNLILNTEVIGKNFSYDNDIFNSQMPGKFKLTEGIYRPLIFGLAGSLGIDFHLGKRHFFSVRLPVRYGLTDVERKGEMMYENEPSYINRTFTTTYYPPVVYSYWDDNSPKGVPNIIGEKRSATHPFSYGLELSYGFRFIPKKRS